MTHTSHFAKRTKRLQIVLNASTSCSFMGCEMHGKAGFSLACREYGVQLHKLYDRIGLRLPQL